MRHEGWNKAREMRYYYSEKCKGMSFSKAQKGLTYIDCIMEAYGNRLLFVDRDGDYWEDYYSIGD